MSDYTAVIAALEAERDELDQLIAGLRKRQGGLAGPPSHPTAKIARARQPREKSNGAARGTRPESGEPLDAKFRAFLADCPNGASAELAAKHWGISKSAATQRLGKLLKAGHLKKAGWGLFALA